MNARITTDHTIPLTARVNHNTVLNALGALHRTLGRPHGDCEVTIEHIIYRFAEVDGRWKLQCRIDLSKFRF